MTRTLHAQSATTGPGGRRPRRALVVQAGRSPSSDSAARALAELLSKAGIRTTYLDRERTAAEIASTAAQQEVDAVELCLAGNGGVLIIRELLQALREVGRRDVSIVVHRVD